MDFSIVSVSREWDEVHTRLHQPSVLASGAYVAAASLLEPGAVAEAGVLRHEGEIAFHPYLRRPVPEAPGLCDAVSPYDFGGIWFSTPDPERRQRLAAAFGAAFADHARRTNLVSAFLRVHPFSDANLLGTAGYAISIHQENVVVRLDAPLDAIRSAYTYSRRKQVRQGRESGLSLKVSDDLDGFVSLYHKNMCRLQADPFYRFPKTFFEAIRSFLLAVEVHAPDGTVCARHLYLPDGKFLFAFLCHADPDRLALRPNDFAYDAMIAEAQRRDFAVFHFGGGAKSLYQYKRSFSTDGVMFYHARRVFLADAYDELVRGRHDRAPGFDPGRFFPAYRAPAPCADLTES